MLNRRGFTAVVFGFMVGCQKAPEPETPRPVAMATADHLTDADVAIFLEIVGELPGGEPPAFEPVTELNLAPEARAAEMVGRWQREFRSAYSPAVQAKLWKRNPRMRLAIEDLGLEPEKFARLLVKLSTAVVRDSVARDIDFRALGSQADRAIASLCEQLDGLDSRPGMSVTVRNGRAEFLASMLKESVAYREFLRLLEAVPAESLATARKHRDVLRPLLPPNETAKAFEKRIESRATVIQASHEEPRR